MINAHNAQSWWQGTAGALSKQKDVNLALEYTQYKPKEICKKRQFMVL